jgi:hypothetical protein
MLNVTEKNIFLYVIILVVVILIIRGYSERKNLTLNLKIDMNKILKIAAIIGILLISFSVAFYFVYYLPNKEKRVENKRSYCNQ